MSSSPAAAKRLESAISICLLIILLLIGLGILIRQSDADMSRFGIDATAGEVSADRAKTDTDSEARLSTFAPAGFQAIGQTQVYTAGNLYEKINGKADFYLDSGFGKLFTRRFKNTGDDTLWFEVYLYDMASNWNAFSVLSRQRRPEVVASKVLEPLYSYRTANSLYCVNGHYYIELVGSAESGLLFKAIMDTRENLRKNLAVSMVTEIPELKFFPAERIVPESFKLYLSDTFGYERLTNTYTARYRMDGEIITSFFSKRPDPQDARNIAQAYHSFLLDSGCSDKTTTNQTLVDLKGNVVDAYGTTEIIFVTGPFVAGVHEADNQQAAEKLAEVLALKLSRIAEEKGD